MKRTMWWAALVVVSACLLPVGCKSKKDESPASGSAAPVAAASPVGSESDACALLTAEEIKGVVAKEVTKSGHGGAGSANVCEYDLGDVGKILTTVYTSSGKETFDAVPGDAVPGVGDQAKVVAAGMLAVLKGETSFTVGVMLFDETTPEQTAEYVKALAAKILGRL